MKVEDAATGEHRRLDHVPRRARDLPRCSASRSILVLRLMSRRFREGDERGRRAVARTARVPTPRPPAPRPAKRAGARERRRRGDPHGRDHRVRAVRRRRLRRRVLGPHRRRRRTRARAARGHQPLDRPGVGGEPRLADLLPGRAVDRVLRGVRVDHAHAVRAAVDRRARHRVPRLELRVPQGGHAHVEPAQLRRRVRDRRR